jgi:hypothetical protein
MQGPALLQATWQWSISQRIETALRAAVCSIPTSRTLTPMILAHRHSCLAAALLATAGDTVALLQDLPTESAGGFPNGTLRRMALTGYLMFLDDEIMHADVMHICICLAACILHVFVINKSRQRFGSSGQHSPV